MAPESTSPPTETPKQSKAIQLPPPTNPSTPISWHSVGFIVVVVVVQLSIVWQSIAALTKSIKDCPALP